MCHMGRGISGLRVGWMHTLNAELRGALDNLAYFAMPSTIIQEACTQMLLDKAFVTSYLKENQRRLAQSYDALTGMVCGGPMFTHISPELWQVIRLQRLHRRLKHCQAKRQCPRMLPRQMHCSFRHAKGVLSTATVAVGAFRIDWSHVSGLST